MSDKLRPVGWVVLAAVIGLYGYRQIYTPLQPGRLHGNDFKHIYMGAIFLGRGWSPYDADRFLDEASRYGFGSINPYVYPPTTGVVLRPLAWLRPRQAQLLWFFLNHAMLIGALLLCIHFFLGWRDPWRIALAALLPATSFPLYRTLTAGQLNCVLLLLYCGVYAAVRGRRHLLAGLAVAFGILFKLVPGIFVVYFLGKRYWRALGWTVLSFGVLLAGSIALAGWRVHADYLPVVRSMRYGQSVWQERLIEGGIDPFYRDPFNQSFNSHFHHLLAPDPVEHEDPRMRIEPLLNLEGKTGAAAANILTALCSFALLGLTLWVVARGQTGCQPASSLESPPREALEVSLMILLSLLIPSIMWDHYVIVLFPVQIVLLARYLANPRGKAWRLVALVVASAILAKAILFQHPSFRHGPGLFIMSAKLYGVLILFALTWLELFQNRAHREDEVESATSDGGRANFSVDNIAGAGN